jgi:hypothetical protein
VSLATHAVGERTPERAVRESEGVYYPELSAVTFAGVAGVPADAVRRTGPGRRTVPHRPPPVLRRILEMFWPGLPGMEVSMS